MSGSEHSPAAGDACPVLGPAPAAGRRVPFREAIRSWLHAGLAAAALVALQLGVAFPWVVAVAALVGLAAHRLGFDAGGRIAAPTRAPARAATAADAAVSPAYVLDDDTPTPAHALPSRSRTIRQLICALALWAGVEGALVLWTGPGSTLSVMGRFFTVAA